MDTATTASEATDWWTWVRVAAGRTLYACLALPVGLVGLALGPFGAAKPIGRVQYLLAVHLLHIPLTTSSPVPVRAGRVVRYCLRALPANLAAFVLIVPLWGLFTTRGLLYPVFGGDNLESSWGGPTLLGAWVAHFVQGPPALLLATLALMPISRRQGRLVTRYFGTA